MKVYNKTEKELYEEVKKREEELEEIEKLET
jgi:hypothetical protein